VNAAAGWQKRGELYEACASRHGGSRVLLLGLDYKKNSSDSRESQTTSVACLLTTLGAQVSAGDDGVASSHLGELVSWVSLTRSAVAEADAMALLTDHDTFDFDLIQREARWILDCRNRLAGANVERL
jgi:UDP-N-acetyl-D-glucosamine dehydrogenase